MRKIRQISSIKFYSDYEYISDQSEIKPEKQFVINVTRHDLDENDKDFILCITDKEILKNIKVGDHIAGNNTDSSLRAYIGKIKINTGKVGELTHVGYPVPEY